MKDFLIGGGIAGATILLMPWVFLGFCRYIDFVGTVLFK